MASSSKRRQQNRRPAANKGSKGKGGKGKGTRLSAPQWEGGKPLRSGGENRRGTMGSSKRGLAPGLAALAVREVESEAHGKGADALSGMGFQVSKCK